MKLSGRRNQCFTIGETSAGLQSDVVDYDMDFDGSCTLNYVRQISSTGLDAGELECSDIGYDRQRVVWPGLHTSVLHFDYRNCTIGGSQRMACWKSSGNGTPTELEFQGGSTMDGKYQQIVSGKYAVQAKDIRVCGLRASTDVRPNEVSCVLIGQGSSAFILSKYDIMPGTKFDSITMMNGGICGIESATKTIMCSSGTPSVGYTLPPEGTFRSLDSAAGVMCGVRTDGRIVCEQPIEPYARRAWL